MIVEKNHQLKTGTVLDGRYEVGSVLGEGGFGITYEGINRNTGKRVAIKEFFCREYMGRASDGTGKTVLTADHGEKRFKTEKRRFLREARIVRDYKDEPSIVSVVDYFEGNETAYIVMEFIEGETLRSYVSNKGKFDPAALFDEIRPLMRSLLKLHNAGIIHRDISPDNIIRNSDGQMVLIDFGSARDLSSDTQTTAMVFKDGYAPPEQYTAGKGSSPAIDIYGLCATLYFCLTGTVPLSSTQRIMYDNLKPVSEKASVPESINDMISKGMALKAEERYRNIGEMLSVIDEAYPYLSPEERARLRRKKITHIVAVAAIILTMAGLLIKLVMENYTAILMKTGKPVSIHFMWENETRAKQMEPLIKRKIAAFSGEKNQETYAKGKEVIAKIPAGQFNDQKPVEIARNYFAPECSSVILYTADGPWGEIKTVENGKDSVPEKYTHFYTDEIESLSIEKGVIPISETSTADIRHIEIVLNEKAAERAAGMLSEPGTIMMAEIGAGKMTMYGHVFSAGDGRTMHLVIPDASPEEQYYKMIRCSTEGDEHQKIKVEEKRGGDLYETLSESLSETQKDYRRPTRCYCESVVEWKSILPGFGRGEYQCSPSEISGDYAILEVTTGERTLDTDEGRKAVRAIKARLDGLQIPYAIGTDYYDRNKIAIKIESRQMYKSEAVILGNYDFAIITNGFTSCPVSAESVLSQDDDIEGIRVIIRDKTSRKKIIQQNEEYGMKHVYLKYGGINIARIDTESFKRQLDKAEIILEDLCTYTINDDIERKKKHIGYVLAVINNNAHALRGVKKLEIFNKEGELSEEGGLYSFDNSCFSELDKYLDEAEKKAEYSAYDMTYGSSDNEVKLIVAADDLNTEAFEQQAAERIKAFIEDNDLYNNDYQLSHVIFNFTNSEKRAEDDCYAEAKITMEAEEAAKAAGSANTADTIEVQYKVSEVDITVSDPRNMYDIEKTAESDRKLRSEMDRVNLEWVKTSED